MDLDWLFKHHPPRTQEDIDAYQAIRDKGRELSETIIKHTPASADQSAAIRKVREAVMTANAARALEGKS